MEVTFMGTGTSEGVPVVGVDCHWLDLENKKNWRTRCSIHVEFASGLSIQVDAAQELRLQCLWNGISKTDLFILTHGHSDHLLGMDDLRRFCEGKALPVYSSPAGLERIRNVFHYAILDKPKFKGYPAFNLQEMPQELEVDGGVIRSILLPHGTFETLGLVFEETGTGKKLTYYCDCKKVSKEARDLARGSDVVILDGLRMPPSHPTHMTIPEAIDVAKDIGAPQTYLTHIAATVDHETISAEMPEGVALAWDGLKLSYS